MKGSILLLALLPCIAGTSKFSSILQLKLNLQLSLSALDEHGRISLSYSSHIIFWPLITYWQSSNVAGHTKKTAVSNHSRNPFGRVYLLFQIIDKRFHIDGFYWR